jgi:hypothetical protein
MAARMPGATFTGCDASALLMRRANDMARGLGLANVEFVEGDLREVAGSLGTFDYVIAHGFYSWVPADVRDAFLALAHGHLAPGGLVYVSYNVLPGCFVRQIGWDAIKLEDAGAATARERLEGARRVRRDLAQAWRAAGGMAAMLAPELADDAGRTDGALYHDDMSGVNQPVYFTAFARHVAAHGLGFLAEAELGTIGAVGLTPDMQKIIVDADPMAREQYIDFARLRRFRQSILAAAPTCSGPLTPAALGAAPRFRRHGRGPERRDGGVRATCSSTCWRALPRYHRRRRACRCAGGARRARERSGWADPPRVLRRGVCELHQNPLPAMPGASERPRARRRSMAGGAVGNRHEPAARRRASPRGGCALAAAAADGTRDRAGLAAALGSRPDAAASADQCLDRFALTGLLES